MAEDDPVGTFRRWAYDVLSPAPFKGHLGKRLMGAFSFANDVWMEAAVQAVSAHWIRENPPADGVALVGGEILLVRYPTETNAQFQSRVARAWEDWDIGGAEGSLTAQLEAAGFPGAIIFRWSPTSASEFIVFFPDGSHTVTSQGPIVGSFTVGDGTIVGPVGITPDQLNTIRQIIRQWKPGAWVCRFIVWELTGWTVGSGHAVGEPGLVVGGYQAVSGAI